MKATSQGGFVLVRVLSEDTNKFNRSWPCSNIPEDASFLFELDSRNGDLVNITMWEDDNGFQGFGGRLDSAEYDGEALLALSHDANSFAVGAGMLPQWARR